MTGITMTDCSVADNVTQAKYELDRAMAASGYTQCAQWAMKWGRALLEVAAEHADEDDCRDYQISDLRAALREHQDENKALIEAMKSAITKLESCL